jgi:ElaB/YqjD/DUF883 family membrane-anchored ribosome-binding protein
MKESQEEITGLQQELQDVLDRMGEITDSNQITTLRYDANRITKKLRDEQSRLSNARDQLEHAEQELRSKARLFVWIDRPEGRARDYLMLCFFIAIFLAGSAAQLKRKDKLLLIL